MITGCLDKSRRRSTRSTRKPGPARGAHRSGRLANDDIGFEFDLVWADPAADAVEEEIGDPGPDAIGRNMDGAERRVELRDDLQIGEARDRDVPRHGDAEHAALA